MLKWLNALSALADLFNWIGRTWSEWRNKIKARTQYAEQVNKEERELRRDLKDVTDRELSDDDLRRRMQDGSF